MPRCTRTNWYPSYSDIRSSRGGLLECGIVLRKPLIALEHVLPIHDRQEAGLNPPTEPTLLARIEDGQGRSHFAAVDELSDDRLAVGGGQRARGVTVIAAVDRLAVHQLENISHHHRRLLAHGGGGLRIGRRGDVA